MSNEHLSIHRGHRLKALPTGTIVRISNDEEHVLYRIDGRVRGMRSHYRLCNATQSFRIRYICRSQIHVLSSIEQVLYRL